MTFEELLPKNIHTVAIAGHTNPDGDCLGSIFSVYHYLKDNFPALSVTAYTRGVTDYISFLTDGISYDESDGEGKVYDLMILLDVAKEDRIDAGRVAFLNAKETLLIDHHETNSGFAKVNHIVPTASSTAEILAGLFNEEKISRDTAICLYTGIVHDSGVFRYPSTTPSTLRLSAMLMEKQIPFDKIIEESVTNQPFSELALTGEVLMSTTLIPEERFAVSYAPLTLQHRYHLTDENLGGVITYINTIKEADVVLFLYEKEDGSWKGSLRSRSNVNVATIAEAFEGGGHGKAAGFSFIGDPKIIAEKVREMVRLLR